MERCAQQCETGWLEKNFCKLWHQIWLEYLNQLANNMSAKSLAAKRMYELFNSHLDRVDLLHNTNCSALSWLELWSPCTVHIAPG